MEKVTKPAESIKISPFGFQHSIKGKVAKETINSTLVSYRAPNVYLVICDYNNAKVKNIANDFISKMMRCNINVFSEEYETHQNGTSIDGKSVTPKSDFFVNLRSSTAKTNQLVLHCGELKYKLHPEEAVQEIWSWWRVRCGALTEEEINCLSPEKIAAIITTFTDIPTSLLSDIQQEMKNYSDKQKVSTLIDNGYRYLENTTSKMSSFKEMDTGWNEIQGRRISRLIAAKPIVGISPPLKKFLNSLMKQIRRKLDALKALNEQKIETHLEQNSRDDAWGHLLGDMNDLD